MRLTSRRDAGRRRPHSECGKRLQLRAALLRSLPAVVIVLCLVDDPVAVMLAEPLDAARPERQARRLQHCRRIRVDRRRQDDEERHRNEEPWSQEAPPRRRNLCQQFNALGQRHANTLRGSNENAVRRPAVVGTATRATRRALAGCAWLPAAAASWCIAPCNPRPVEAACAAASRKARTRFAAGPGAAPQWRAGGRARAAVGGDRRADRPQSGPKATLLSGHTRRSRSAAATQRWKVRRESTFGIESAAADQVSANQRTPPQRRR